MKRVTGGAWWVARVCLLLLFGCSEPVAPTMMPTEVVVEVAEVAAEPTDQPVEAATATTVLESTDVPATAASEPTPTVDLDELENTVRNVLRTRRERTAVTTHEGAFSFAYPNSWQLREAAETVEVQSDDAENLMLIRLVIVEDEDKQFDLISDGLLSETRVAAVSDLAAEDREASLETLDGDAAELFGETYLQLQRAVFQNDQLILITGETALDNDNRFQTIFDNVLNSMIDP